MTLLKFPHQAKIWPYSKSININHQEKRIKRKELIHIFNGVLYNGIKSINPSSMKKALRTCSVRKN
ncbi:hypothetical protein BD770DRAFT_390596 [Pilaira anomala]|nr:hypothetical protein BD770DRAFT_390596 [Pilaira anomala]